MKILYVAMESSNWVINLCNEIADAGHDITCLVQTLDDYDVKNELPIHENLKVIRMPYSHFIRPSDFQSNHFKTIAKEEFDIVFGSHIPVVPMVEALGRYYNIPWGIMILDIPTDLMKKDPSRMDTWLTAFHILKTAKQVVFNTTVARDEYEKYTNRRWGDDNVITYGTNLPPELKGAGLNITGDYVISVCRLTDNKNCKLIPEALRYLNNIKKYIAIGRDGGELELIQQQCEEYGIEFVHYSEIPESEKFELIKNSAMLIYPQKTEYIGGLSPFEGIYLGKPVLVPRLKVLSDLYGESVFAYFENDNALSLAESIAFAHSFNKDTYKDWFTKSIDFAETEASYKRMSERLIKVFERMKQ